MRDPLLRPALRRQRGRLVGGVALLCLHQATEALVPVMIGVVIDQAVATSDTRALLLSLAGLILLFTVLAYAYRTGARLSYAAGEHEAHGYRVRIAGRALDPRGRRSGAGGGELRDGELLSIAASDADQSSEAIRLVGVALAACTALLVSATALLLVDPVLGIGVLLGVPLVLFGLQRLAPLLTRRSDAQQAALAETSALAVDLVAGLRVLRGIGAQHHAAGRFAAASRVTLANTLRAANTKGLHLGLTTAVNGLLLATVTGAAGWLALTGRITVGELIAVVGLAQFIAEPVQTLGWCVQGFATARASALRVARVIDAPPALRPGDASAPAPAPERVVLSDLAYGTLSGLDLRIAAGETIGILAYDPRDAEALLAVLAGTVPVEDYRGSVRIDGAPAESLRLAAARGVVLVEPHDVALFEGSLRDNLAVGTAASSTRGGATGGAAGADGATGAGGADAESALLAAVRVAAAEDVLETHPDGLDQVLLERGANLSGGQRQRVALARAVAAEPPVLVLHDPTTAVDAVTEALIAERLTAARGERPRATVVVTSSPALLRAADRVVVLDGGRIVAEGTHEDLTARETRYRETVLR